MEQKLLKKLKRKFVFTNMLLVFLVLATVFTIVSVVNYNQCENQVYSALERQANQNQNHQANLNIDKITLNSTKPVDAQNNVNKQEPREIRNDEIVAVSTYEVDEQGNITSVIGDSLALDETIRSAAIENTWNMLGSQPQIKGFSDSNKLYYFAKNLNGKAVISFASQNYVYTSMAGLIVNLGLSCLAALCIFFIISFFLAKWALRPVEKAWAQQTQFIADASHELKTPLTVILANMSILKKESFKQNECSKWISSTESEAKDMQVLVEDMLELAKTESQTSKVSFESVDFSKIVESCTLHFESVAFENGSEIEVAIEPEIKVEGSSAQLRRLVSTLIENACKYSNNASSIKVSLKRTQRTCKLTVSNPSGEMSEEEMSHMFDRFYKADKSRSGETRSYGLGLAIAKEIVNSHGGQITAKYEDGITTFTVCLPS